MGESELKTVESNSDLLVNTRLSLAVENSEEISSSRCLEEVQSTNIDINMMSSFLVKASREEIPGREDARLGPPDGQQDPGRENSKEKTLGMKVV